MNPWLTVFGTVLIRVVQDYGFFEFWSIRVRIHMRDLPNFAYPYLSQHCLGMCPDTWPEFPDLGEPEMF